MLTRRRFVGAARWQCGGSSLARAGAHGCARVRNGCRGERVDVERERCPRAVPVADGIQARVLGSATPQFLKGPQDVVFLDKGRQAGVAAGDIFEVRRPETRRSDGATSVPEVMAVLQIVRVGERSATARILNVMLPAFGEGAESRQIGRLPS